MKKISLEEAYISPYFEKYCKLDNLLEYAVFTGKNKNKYNYLLDPDNIRFKEADDWLKSLPISKKNKEMIAWKNANNLLKLY